MIGHRERDAGVTAHDGDHEHRAAGDHHRQSRRLAQAEPSGAETGGEPEPSEHGVDASKKPPVANAHDAASSGEPAHRHPADRPLESDGRGVETDHAGGG